MMFALVWLVQTAYVFTVLLKDVLDLLGLLFR